MRFLAGLGAALMLLSLGTPGGLLGQGSRTAVGAYVGYSRTDLVGSDAAQSEARQGALTGVYLHIPLSRTVTLRPELSFALKGGRTETEDGSVIDTELAYLRVADPRQGCRADRAVPSGLLRRSRASAPHRLRLPVVPSGTARSWSRRRPAVRTMSPASE